MGNSFVFLWMRIFIFFCRNKALKKLKKRGIKTDNGFDIKADLTDFEGQMKYSVRQNPDGSIDIVIKNVRFYEEK